MVEEDRGRSGEKTREDSGEEREEKRGEDDGRRNGGRGEYCHLLVVSEGCLYAWKSLLFSVCPDLRVAVLFDPSYALEGGGSDVSSGSTDGGGCGGGVGGVSGGARTSEEISTKRIKV